MRPGNRPEIPPLHAIAGLVMRIIVAAVVIGGVVIVATYFALGRPDALFAGGAFPQLVSGARSLSATVPATDPALTSILRIAVIGVVGVLVALIGAAGVRDAWQSRQRRAGHPLRDDSGRPDAGTPTRAARRGSSHQADRTVRAPTDPDTLQGGTA